MIRGAQRTPYHSNVMNEQHHVHFIGLWCHWWPFWIQLVARCAKHGLQRLSVIRVLRAIVQVLCR